MPKVTAIEGIGQVTAQKLEAIGINSTETLLERGASKSGRKDLSRLTGISEQAILEWINCADLMRVKGVGGQYAELLQAAGVDTVAELARRNATNLHNSMSDLNEARRLVRQLPAPVAVAGWVAQAKSLPQVVTHQS